MGHLTIINLILSALISLCYNQEYSRFPPYPQPQPQGNQQFQPSPNNFQPGSGFQPPNQFQQQQPSPWMSILGGLLGANTGQPNGQLNGPPPPPGGPMVLNSMMPMAGPMNGALMANQMIGGQQMECAMPPSSTSFISTSHTTFDRNLVNRSGLCVSSPMECRGRGGQVLGPCFRFRSPAPPLPYGACCHFEATCGQSIHTNGSHFRSPNFPNPYSDPGSCQVTIKNTYRNICQIRLDFNVFNLKQPVGGNCDSDRFLLSGHSNNDIIPPLCGYNPGQHVYVEVDNVEEYFPNSYLQIPYNPNSNSNLMTINIITSGNRNRWFDIKINYIPCNSPYRAPSHCLQYHYNLLGSIKSFNYDIFNQGFTYMNNLDYTICFKKSPGFCTTTYSVPREEDEGHGNELFHETDREQGSWSGGSEGEPFKRRPELSTRPERTYFDITPGQRDSSQTAHAGPYKCPSDYIMLNGIRLCGYHLNDNLYASSSLDVPITDNSTGPIFARFVSSPETVGKGFYLNYQMNPCMINGK